jgi:hypothetical protein
MITSYTFAAYGLVGLGLIEYAFADKVMVVDCGLISYSTNFILLAWFVYEYVHHTRDYLLWLLVYPMLVQNVHTSTLFATVLHRWPCANQLIKPAPTSSFTQPST